MLSHGNIFERLVICRHHQIAINQVVRHDRGPSHSLFVTSKCSDALLLCASNEKLMLSRIRTLFTDRFDEENEKKLSKHWRKDNYALTLSRHDVLIRVDSERRLLFIYLFIHLAYLFIILPAKSYKYASFRTCKPRF